jgi:hypothetical protein
MDKLKVAGQNLGQAMQNDINQNAVLQNDINQNVVLQNGINP